MTTFSKAVIEPTPSHQSNSVFVVQPAMSGTTTASTRLSPSIGSHSEVLKLLVRRRIRTAITSPSAIPRVSAT